jgi:two-component system sensor histidine kinase HupT/HoxJ
VDQPAHQNLRDKYRIDRIEKDMGSLIEGTMEGAERISEIVQDLRRYSGGQREAQERFDLVQVVETATHWVVKACRVKPAIAFELCDGLEVFSRQGQVHQILVNLIQNAVDVTEAQPSARLQISCKPEDGMARVAVRDSGPGITEAEMHKLFDPFYTTKPVGKGTGLGLYISYGLAKELGGDLAAENHHEGGAVFTLSLPLDGANSD